MWEIFNIMNKEQLKTTVKTLIFDLLKEQTEEKPEEEKPEEEKPKRGPKGKPGEIITKPGGGGRYKKFVAEAGARAKKDPKGLMKDLGVTSAAAGDDLAQVLKILNSAIHSNAIMGQGYTGARKVTEEINGESINGVGISLAKLDARNGMKFISHTLQGAKAAGYLNLKGGLKIAPGKSAPIAILST